LDSAVTFSWSTLFLSLITAATEWILWEHRFGKRVKSDLQWKESTTEVCHFFGTEPPFHCDLHHLPLPSKTFFLKDTHHHQHGKKDQGKDHHQSEHKAPPTHKEYSLFKKGILPDWEDPKNATGGCWYCRQYLQPEFLDHYWQNLVRGVVEAKIENEQHTCLEHVNGVRIDDKSKGKHPLYKIEIWIDTNDAQIRDRIRDRVMQVMQEDEPSGKKHHLKLHWRDFTQWNHHHHDDDDHHHPHEASGEIAAEKQDAEKSNGEQVELSNEAEKETVAAAAAT